jgi:quercetin dioxygenase-like cupin family protein/SAM-dependent methyltransferase
MTQAVIKQSGEGRTVAVVGDVYRFLATGEDTNGKYALWEAIVPPGGGPPLHVHSREEEGFYILEGEVSFQVGEKRIVASTGMFANMSVGTPHTFKNETDRPARMLISVVPAGLEQMFFEVPRSRRRQVRKRLTSCWRSLPGTESRSGCRPRPKRSRMQIITDNQPSPMPGEALNAKKMPGHWLLARLGKRVLRPGVRLLTFHMIEALNVGPSDDVVEFAPGLGDTARLTLKRNPASYTAVERDKDAATRVQKFLQGTGQRCVVGLAEHTGLPNASATVVYGEAILSMQTPDQKSRIVQEAHRLLRPGGHYGIHELCLAPDDLDESTKDAIQNELSAVIRHGTRPLTTAEWQCLLESEGFSVRAKAQAPMHLLEPWRLIQDEGMLGAMRFAFNLLCNAEARRRVFAMRRVFSKYRNHLSAVMIVGQKKESGPQ